MSNLQFSFNISAAESFLNEFSSKDNSYYLLISRPQSWEDENTPPVVVDSVNEQTNLWLNAIAAKKITSKDVRLVINRNDWETGTVYSQFSDVNELFRSATYDNQPFYVMNSEYKIYKCLDNNGGSESTVEPTHTYPDFQTPGEDGYVWQFMYQLTEDDFDFVSSDYIPVSLAGSTTKIGTIEYLQREVQENARGGGIYNIRVNQTGSYWTNARILKGGEDLTEVYFDSHRVSNIENDKEYTPVFTGETLDVARFTVSGMSSFSRDYYKGWAITDYDMGTGTAEASGEGDLTKIGYYKKILGNSGEYVYTERFETDPVTTEGFYNIVPYIYISNGTGSTAETNVVVAPVFDNLSGTTDADVAKDNELIILDSKVITRVRSLDPGSDVFQPYVMVSPTPTGIGSGIGFDADAFSSPMGGHGSNAIYELGANKVMIRAYIKGSEDGAFDVQNDFRQFALIKNPQNAGWTSGIEAGSIAGSKTPDFTVLDVRNDNNTVVIDFRSENNTHESDAFSVGQKVHQGEYSLNQARGTVLNWVAGSAGKLTLSVDNGKFRPSVDPDEIPDTETGRIFYGETFGSAYTGGGDPLNDNDYGGFIDQVITSKSFLNQTFPQGSIVYGLTSRSTGLVSSWRTESDGERGTMILSGVVGDFVEPRVALGTQLDGEKVFAFRSLNEDGSYQITNSPVGTITKISKLPVLEDESHRLTEKVTAFFANPSFQISPSLLDEIVTNSDSDFQSTLVSIKYTEGVTSGPNGSTVDMYLTTVSGSLTAGDEINLNGYTASFISHVESEFLPYTGQVLYIENVRPVQRNADQDEEFKLVIDF